ncbi:MAG: DNA helicase, partial [Candidatus Hinthialibacter sp.]
MNPTESPQCLIQNEFVAKLNYACFQSSVPFLRDLRIRNLSRETRLENLLIKLTSNPSFLKSKSWQVDQIAPDGEAVIHDRDLELNGDFLLNMTESTKGGVSITVETNGRFLAEETKPIELLAYNEWGGAGYMPELLAAFSMPNDPAVDRVLHDASLLLRRAAKPDGMDGYQSKSRQRVWEIASSIYTAIANFGLSYAVPPASFEQDGQKIRLPGHILETRVATCLDLTMLFASALEQAGLNPLIVLPRGHAVVGVWLQP